MGTEAGGGGGPGQRRVLGVQQGTWAWPPGAQARPRQEVPSVVVSPARTGPRPELLGRQARGTVRAVRVPRVVPHVTCRADRPCRPAAGSASATGCTGRAAWSSCCWDSSGASPYWTSATTSSRSRSTTARTRSSRTWYVCRAECVSQPLRCFLGEWFAPGRVCPQLCTAVPSPQARLVAVSGEGGLAAGVPSALSVLVSGRLGPLHGLALLFWVIAFCPGLPWRHQSVLFGCL